MSDIVFTAEVFKIQTILDGGVRVTLDLPETAIPQMAMLAEARREGIPLIFRASVYSETENRTYSGDSKRRKR